MEKKVEYMIVPAEPFKIIRGCGGCGNKKTFVCKGKFRVNANGRKLDVWLIYGCEECAHTYNLPIYERISPEKTCEQDYKLFLQNDSEMVLRMGADKELFLRNRAEIAWKEVVYRLEPMTTTEFDVESDYVSVSLHNPSGIPVREDKVVAEIFEISRSNAKKLLDEGKVVVEILAGLCYYHSDVN